MHTCLRPIAPVAAALALAACFPDPALLDDDVADTHVEADVGADAQPAPDGDPGETDTGETASGECETPADCQHLAANCVKVLCLANTCATQPDPGASCDDGDACTKDDTCAGTTCAGTAYGCDDGVACTADQCDGEGGCTYPVADGFCRIDNLCVTAGDTKEGDPCRICEGGEAWSPNDGASCEDGDAICTTGDTCAGTTCVGGSRPSDADTDWVLRPVEVVAPATAAVVGLIGVGEDVVFVSESAGGASAELVNGSRVYPGASIQVLRRSSAGLSEYLSLDGFEYARVVSPRISDTRNGRLGFAYRYRGEGELRENGEGATAISGEGFEAIFLQTFPASVLFRVPISGVLSTANFATGIAVLSEFTDSFTSPAPERTILHTSPDGPAELAVTRLSNSGFSDWLAHIGGGRIEIALICASEAGVVHVTFAHSQPLTIVDGVGGTHSIGATGEDVRSSWVAFSSTGRLLGTSTVFTHPSLVPGDTNWPGSGMYLLHCDDTSILAAAVGQAETSQLPMAVSGGSGSNFTLVTTEVGNHSASSRSSLVGITPTTVSLDLNGERWLAGLVSHEASWLTDGGQLREVGTFESSMMGLFRLDGNDMDGFHQALSNGFAAAAGIVRTPTGGLVVGGNTLFSPPTFVGADGSFPLSQPSDIGAFLFGLNSKRGLECSLGLP